MRFFQSSTTRSKLSAASIWALLSISVLPTSTMAADKKAADYFVHDLPGAPAGPLLKMHAGHIEVHPEVNGNLFFWLFHNRHIGDKQRTIIWLNGGPGCSSLDGALMEIGPYRVKSSGKGNSKPELVYNDGAWDEFANVIFVDNPVGTGFSFVDSNSYVHELPEMANQFVIFLEKLFAMFPEYEHDDLYIAGESYAGQHIPYITRAILDRNKKGAPEHQWNMKSMLIGNGWIDPEAHYKAYLAFAYEKGIVKRDSEIASRLESVQSICLKALKEKGSNDKVDIGSCENILQEILRETQQKEHPNQACVNMYDVRLRDSYPSCGMNWPPDLEQVTPYLRRSDVVAALHVDPAKRTGWRECDGQVGAAFRASASKPSIQLLPDLIKEVPTVLFSGAEDLICNHIGTEDLISNMQWNGGKGFETSPGNWAPRRNWVFEGEQAGFWQEARNLTYVLFNNSSHMVPFDYARRTRDMLDRIMGVDIGSIGGVPTDSRIDGEKGIQTSVGGHPNSTAAEANQQEKLDAAKWHAYYKSGEIVLVIVAFAAAAWGYYIWRERRKTAGYKGVLGGDSALSLGGASARVRGYRDRFRGGAGRGDVEAADFDESELDELHIRTPTEEPERDQYSVGSESDDETDEKGKGRAHGNGKKPVGEKS